MTVWRTAPEYPGWAIKSGVGSVVLKNMATGQCVNLDLPWRETMSQSKARILEIMAG